MLGRMLVGKLIGKLVGKLIGWMNFDCTVFGKMVYRLVDRLFQFELCRNHLVGIDVVSFLKVF